MAVKVREILGLKSVSVQEQASPVFCLPKEKIGLEYEWENTSAWAAHVNRYDAHGTPLPANITATQRLFNIHQDGSLRQNGCEWVFKNGYSGTMILSAIDAMDETSRINDFMGSYRTSLHVHLNVQDLEYPHDITRLGAVYCVVEPFLYDFVGENRDCCNYCTPWSEHPGHFEAWFAIVNNSRLKSLKGSEATALSGFFKNSKIHKYSGLNFFSLGDFGTVEFRHAPVTMQKAKIIQWINIIMRLKKWVIANPQITGDSLITRVSTIGAEAFLKEVFEEDFLAVTRRTRDIHSAFKRGVSTLFHYVSLT